MNDPIEEESTALLALFEDWRRAVACGLGCLEQVRMLRRMAIKADELAEMVDPDDWPGSGPVQVERLRYDDEFADIIDQWGDRVPEAWL